MVPRRRGRLLSGPCGPSWPPRCIFPVLLAFVLGGLRVKTEFDQARQFSSAAESTLLLRPVIEYNLAVQRLAASAAPGGEGIDSAAAAYDKASAKVTAALQTASVSDTVATQTKNALRLGKGVRSAVSQTGFPVRRDRPLGQHREPGLQRRRRPRPQRRGIGQDPRRAAGHHRRPARHDGPAAQPRQQGRRQRRPARRQARRRRGVLRRPSQGRGRAPNSSDVRQLINENGARAVYLQRWLARARPARRRR